MKIVVTVKQIPDPNAPQKLTSDNRLDRGGEAVLDPGDEYGVEAGLKLKEAHGGEVVLVSMGPAKAADAIRKGLSMGADRAIHVSDDSLAGADALLTAQILAAAIKPEEHVYSTGGHGFGMKKQGTTSDHWIDEFGYWLDAQGFTKAKRTTGSSNLE